MAIQMPRVSSRLDLLYLVAREFNAGLEDSEQALYNVLSATVASVAASDASLYLFDKNGDLEISLLISDFEVLRPGLDDLRVHSEQGLVGWVREHREGAVIADTNHDTRWYEADANIPEFCQAGSAICVPIQLRDQLIGILTIFAPQANHFDKSDLALLSIVGDQAAIALSNIRLIEAEQHRRRVADTLSSITHTINSTLNITKVLDLILEQLSLVVDYDSSSILLYEDDGDTLAVRAARGFDDMEDALTVKLPFDEEIPNYQAITEKKPILIADVDTEPRWIKSSSSADIRSWIGAPLIARDEVVGMLTVDSHEVNKYTVENVGVVAAFAEQAATAVANAQAVTRLRNAEASYSALFEDNTDMIVITNYQGLILHVNRTACQVLRRHKEALINLDVAFIDPRLPAHLTRHEKRLRVWREATFELEVKDAYRQLVPLEFKLRQVQFRGKDCVQWVGRDFSQRKEIEQLRQDMVNMLVHDLRGPLGNLISAIDLTSLLIENEADISKITHFLEMGRRSGQAITDMVDSMLDVSRLEQGEMPLQRTPTDLRELLQAVEDQVTHRAIAKEMELKIHEPPTEANGIWLDSSMIRRVLVNLVGNAIKYTPDRGHVSLKTSVSKGNQLHFAVSDDGPGISKLDQAHIFQKFSRADHTSSTPGVGLGLAFCKLATEAHDGTISVDSEGIPDQGTTFHVYLPIVEEVTTEEKP
jgi:PAS domain S-box-containing protein